MSASVEIIPVLCLSTAHMDQQARDYLPALPVAEWEYGWFVWVPDPDEPQEPPVPRSLAEAFAVARSHSCLWVRFDSAGPTLPGLPVYEEQYPFAAITEMAGDPA